MNYVVLKLRTMMNYEQYRQKSKTVMYKMSEGCIIIHLLPGYVNYRLLSVLLCAWPAASPLIKMCFNNVARWGSSRNTFMSFITWGIGRNVYNSDRCSTVSLLDGPGKKFDYPLAHLIEEGISSQFVRPSYRAQMWNEWRLSKGVIW